MNFDHIVLNVGDMDNMLKFYEKVMLFSVERLEEYRNGTAPFPIIQPKRKYEPLLFIYVSSRVGKLNEQTAE